LTFDTASNRSLTLLFILLFRSYFIQTAVKANGSLAFAAGAGAGVSQGRFQAKPKPLPYAPGRSAREPNHPVDACRLCKDKSCAHELNFSNGTIRHGAYNNGATPPWEASLVLDLLTPARNMNEIADKCRTVILASGSLAPLPSLCAELGLRASHVAAKEENVPLERAAKPTKAEPTKAGESVTKPVSKGRLQDRPAPLEADHVISLEKQLMAVAIGHFPDGSSLTVNYNQYKHDSFLIKLGDAIATVIESIPRGGVLVFLSSYALLKRCTKAWNPAEYDRYARADNNDESDAWNRMIRSKGKVIVEPTGGQSDFEAAKAEYAEAIRVTGNCVLFAVFRGKMSEGISFNDDNARGVICVGIPFPSSFDRSIKAKKSYNDEQRKLERRLDLLSGDSWYSQQAYRAIAQALGRCIRHAGDYGKNLLSRVDLDLQACLLVSNSLFLS
jgi:Rad3-related DNA helicase